MTSGQWVLSIDFGTSNTVVASRVAEAAAEVIEIDGARHVPSVVMITDEFRVVVGRPAEVLADSAPSRLLRSLKSRLGDPAPIIVGGRPLQATPLVAEVLAKVYEEAVRVHGSTPQSTRVTYPAAWTGQRQQQLLRAAELAGLERITLVPEAVAAAIDYADESAPAVGSTVLVHDLGGGSLNWAVVRVAETGFEFVAGPGADPRLGGEMFDELVANMIGERLPSDVWERLQVRDDAEWRQAWVGLQSAARRAKELLSTQTTVDILLALPTGTQEMLISRAELDDVVGPHIAESAHIIRGAAAESGCAIDDLGAIYLIGGGSRMLVVESVLAEAFPGVPIARPSDPTAAVALGGTHLAPIVVHTALAHSPSSTAPPAVHRRRHRVGVIAALASLALALGGLGIRAAVERDAKPSETGGTSTARTAATTTAAVVKTGGVQSETTGATAVIDMDALTADCKSEGGLNLVALPEDASQDEGVLASFGQKYPGVTHDVANLDGSSKDVEDAVQTLVGQADQADTVTVSPDVAQDMVDKGLFEPYTPTVAGEVPPSLQDPEHNWVAAYYGIIAIATNTTVVPNAPKSFADLAKPEYRGLVALNGDPRASDSAFAAVVATALANGGSADDIMPGIQFFANLKKSGNLGDTDVAQATVLSGQTPIAIDWSYNVSGLKAALEGAGLGAQVNFPTDAVYGGFSAEGVVKGAPHEACSKLWLEHILSDDGGLGYLAAGAVPARYQSLVDSGKVTDDLKANLPSEDQISRITFLSPSQMARAKNVLATNWGPMVADAG